jgi:hypothetical protein
MSAGKSGARKLNLPWKFFNGYDPLFVENGFIEVGKSHDGSAAWCRKATPDANTSVHKRVCINSLTR